MYVTTPLRTNGQQAGVYLVTPGRANGLSGHGHGGRRGGGGRGWGGGGWGIPYPYPVYDEALDPADCGDCSTCRAKCCPKPAALADWFAAGDRETAIGEPLPATQPAAINSHFNSIFNRKTALRNGPGGRRMSQAAQGLAGPFDGVFFALGLLDPIAQAYPGMTPQQAYVALRDDVNLAKSKLPGLRSAGTQAALSRQLYPISATIASLGAAFSGGTSAPGKNEIDKLGQAILDNDAYTKAWRKAKATYGYQDPTTGETEGPVAPAVTPMGAPAAPPASAGIADGPPWLMIGLAAAAVGTAIVLSKRKRRSA